MKFVQFRSRTCAALVAVIFTGCVSSVPQDVRIVTNEPEAEIVVNGTSSGTGHVRLKELKPNSGPLDLRISHEDYSDYTLHLEPTVPVNMSFKEKAPWVAGGAVAAVLGLVGLISSLASGEEEPPIAPLVAGAGLMTMGTFTMVNVPLNTFKKFSYENSYSLDLSPNRKYSELGYDRISGYNKAGFNVLRQDAAGNYYEGPLVDWKKEGSGAYVWADGTRYLGGFVADLPSGFGLFVDEAGGTFIGSWKDGKEDGAGVYITPEGDQYREFWKGGEKVASQPAGLIISEAYNWAFFGEGRKNGRAHGRGNAVTVDLSVRVENGLYDEGILKSGRMIMSDGTVYSGRFADERLVEGEIFSTDGTYYKGMVKNGVPEGAGFLRSSDGTVYEGNFVQAKFEGRGSLTLANGDVYEGPFKNGVPHGEGVYKNKSENLVEKCEFYEGRRIDQAYQIRIAQAKEAERKRLEAEAAQKAAEEAAKRERERQKRLEEQRREAEANKKLTAGIFGFGAAAMGSHYGMDAAEAAKFGTAVAKDVYQGTDGEYMKAAGDEIIANRRSMAEYEQKYGAGDLSDSSSYTESLKTPTIQSQSQAPVSQPVDTSETSVTSSSTGEVKKITIPWGGRMNYDPRGSGNASGSASSGGTAAAVNSRMQPQASSSGSGSAGTPGESKKEEEPLAEPFEVIFPDAHLLQIPEKSGHPNVSSREEQIPGQPFIIRVEYTDTKWLPHGVADWSTPYANVSIRSTDGHVYRVKVDKSRSGLHNCELTGSLSAITRKNGDWGGTLAKVRTIDGRERYSYELVLMIEQLH